MAEMKADIDSDAEQNYSLGSNVDPKNMQELTIYVRDSIISKRISTKLFLISGPESPSECAG